MRVSLHKPNSVYFSSSRFVRFHSNTSPPPSNNSNSGGVGDAARRLNVEKLVPSAYHLLQRPAEELAMLSAKEIENLWMKQLYDKTCIFACIPVDTHKKLTKRAQESTMFVLPLPKHPSGFETFFSQYNGKRWLFTQLLRYQRDKVQAVPSLIITVFEEFLATKGIALMKGDVDLKSMTTPEAQTLLNMAQAFYLHDEKYPLVVSFNRTPERFDFTHVIKKIETGLEK